MTKQYKLIEELENGEKIPYTFDTKKEIKEFINVLDHFNFTVKEECIGISI
jgi:hypothetical protein